VAYEMVKPYQPQ